ncbi:MAG: chorismate mutase [Spirochaetaceae bacterium]|jgi:chorismate mutase|nr:chorismate mutase [Spirochaetaceae bacterium]
MKKIGALRGATQVLNEENDIVEQIGILYDELLFKNHIAEQDIISIIFSVTDDITAKNPAAALRQSGRAAETPLFSTLEPKIPPLYPRIIRVLLHAYLEDGVLNRHIYRNGAELLRSDWAAASN